MKYIKFEIKKYKGINDLVIDLSSKPGGKIFPLVGLNESGKTTILESINFFQTEIDSSKQHEIIHKKDSGSFTGKIEIKATLELDKKDKGAIRDFISSKSLVLEKDIDKFTLARKHIYKNARYEKTVHGWAFDPVFKIKTNRQKKFRRLRSTDKPIWDELVATIRARIPKILHFPNFLFDFPEKIYLENIDTLKLSEKDKSIQYEYKQIIDDILRCINSSYSLTDYLTKLKSTDSPDQQSASSQIKQEMSSIMNKKIVKPWQQIFPGPNKSIQIETANDTTGYFIQIKIVEGTSPFMVNERSLGFKWFFSFILFTEFRKKRKNEFGEYIFLLDEPASNLHERSQQKLLKLFENLIDNAKIIYSTHSPYLINKKTILNSFVVKDKGRKKGGDDWNFRQDIKSVLYKQFVSAHTNPNDKSHFRPILDVLEFVDNPFTPTGRIIFFEGKFDYYTFKLIENKFFSRQKYDFNFFPGNGAESYENIFREYLANNRKFISVFDSDDAGKKAVNGYIKNVSQELENNLYTLCDVDNNFDKFVTEDLFTKEEKIVIQKKTFPSSMKYKKSEFNTAIQDLFIKDKDFDLSKETKENFKKIFDFIKQKFTNLK